MLQNVGHLERKLSTFVRLSDLERQCLNEIQQSPVFVKGGQELTRQGESGHVAYILQQGWGCSFKDLQDGSRQVIAFPIPGDCVGLRSILLRTSDHAFSTITDAQVSRFEVPRILEIFDKFPHLGAAILWATSRDEAITVEHLASVGRRTAIERTAHFFLELSDRLRMVGLASETEFECPLNQYILADALGLSAIHVNRVLRELREVKLLTFQDRRVVIHDRKELMALAGYEEVEPNAFLERKT
jgi:cAMP-binding proteins - catabolite gene activator and regulatory subunit of cAMP-dependent protein kinases